MSSKNKSISLRKHLIKSASGSLVLKIGQTGLNLALAVVLARLLGVEGLGIYAFCLSIVQILTVPAMFGGQQLLVREVAAYKIKGEYGLMRGLLKRIHQANLAVSVILAFAAGGICYYIYANNTKYLFPFLVAIILIPLLSKIQLQGATLRGLRYILIGQGQNVFRPLLMLICVGIFYYFWGVNLTPTLALTAQVISTGLIFVAFWIIVYLALPKDTKTTNSKYETSKWIHSALPFVFAAGMQILNHQTSVVFLGILQGAESVGVFRVAQRGAELIPFGLMAVNMAIGPTASQLFTQGNKQHLQKIVNKSILAILAFSLPVSLALILSGKWLIPFVFGLEFSPAYPILVILCIGQLVNAAMGSVGLLLNMAGLERFTARGVAIAAVASIVLNVTLIPFLGTFGAAIATTSSLIIWNVLLAVWLYKETGILSTIRITFKAA